MLDIRTRARAARSVQVRKRFFVGLVVCCLGAMAILLAFGLSSSPKKVRVGSPATAALKPSSAKPAGSVVTTGLIASLTKSVAAFHSPGGPSAAGVAATWHGSPLSLPVIASRGGYLEVRLPTRPNGSTTWIRRSAVHLYHSSYRIVVNLGTHHLLLYRDGKLVLDALAGVGTVADPTPTGRFFVALFAKAPTPAWGPFVLVTSAHSNAISDWEQSGDAIVAIHGPLGEASAIRRGERISHGCVRLLDGDLAKLRVVPDGSPVDIIA